MYYNYTNPYHTLGQKHKNDYLYSNIICEISRLRPVFLQSLIKVHSYVLELFYSKPLNYVGLNFSVDIAFIFYTVTIQYTHWKILKNKYANYFAWYCTTIVMVYYGILDK